MTPPRSVWALVAWAALGLQKALTLGVTFVVAQLGGAEALGAQGTLLTWCGLLGSALHLGLPDWAQYAAASERAEGKPLSERHGAAHAAFLASALLAAVVSAALVPWLVQVPSLRVFGWLVVVGFFLPHFSAFASSTWRGRATPAAEALGLLLSALAQLALFAFLVPSLIEQGREAVLTLEQFAAGTALAAAGLLVPLGASFRCPELRPRMAGLGEVPQVLTQSVRYVGLTVLTTLVWTGDLWVTRWGSDVAEVGRLRAGVTVLHGGLFGATLFGTMLVHRVKADAVAARASVLGVGPVLSVIAIGLAWVSSPFLVRPGALTLGEFETVLLTASVVAPIAYTATAWLPLAIGLDLWRAAAACAAALGVMAPAGLVLARWGAVGGVLTLGLGQLVFIAVVARRVLGVVSGSAPGGAGYSASA